MPSMTNNDINRPDTAPADQDWFGGRRWTGIAAVGFLIVIALCVVIVVALNRGGGSNNAGGGTSSTSASASRSTGTTGNASVAALPTTLPTAAPANTTWTIYQTVALPTVPGVGPTHVNGAVATGYAHTPIGALVADVNASYRYLLAPDTQWKQAAAAMLAAGPGQAAWMKRRAQHSYGPGGAASAGVPFAQVAGFQFVSYTPTDAVIQVVTQDATGNLQVGTDHVTWASGDWKYVNAPDGSQNANVQSVDSLAGFIEWRGV